MLLEEFLAANPESRALIEKLGELSHEFLTEISKFQFEGMKLVSKIEVNVDKQAVYSCFNFKENDKVG